MDLRLQDWNSWTRATARALSTQGKQKDPSPRLCWWGGSGRKGLEEEAELGFLLMGTGRADMKLAPGFPTHELPSLLAAMLGSSCCCSLGGKVLGSSGNTSELARKCIN